VSTAPSRPFQRIAIVNRGEPAMRLIRAVRELASAGGPVYRTVAFYTDPDRQALFVREADEALRLGPATFVDSEGQHQSGYLDYARLEAALVEAKADAAWVGWGFVAEKARFAELCERLGVVFIGPPASAIRELGNKVSAKRLAAATGVPLRAWSDGPVATLDDAMVHARRIGFPLMVKASAGGGGRGVRLVGSEGELEDAMASARSEAAIAFGDSSVFLEEYVPRARHVEVQVLCDSAGGGWAVGVRDCSVQRRFQKVIEESSSTALSAEQDLYLRAAAVRMCLAAGYRGAGTVEFLLNPTNGALSFLEVNARLQVEHAVTETTTGADLVKLQLHVAAGGRLEGDPPAAVGHAIEARLYAEDPERGFAPSAGLVERLRLPGGPGIRVDTGVAEGDLIPAEFDSMIAKIVAWGQDRSEALARLTRAVEETRVVIRDGATNRALLLGLLKHPDLRRGDVDINWMERTGADSDRGDGRSAKVALLAAAVESYDEEVRIDQAHFYASAARGRPEVGSGVGKTIDLQHGGFAYRFTVYRVAQHGYRVVGEGGQAEIHLNRMGRFERHALVDGQRYRVEVITQSAGYLVEVDGSSHRVTRAGGANVRAPSPAIVVAILVQPGQLVSAGTPVAVLEAMKTMTQVLAPVDGTVSQVFTTANVQVEASAPLMHIEPGRDTEVAAGRRITFDAPVPVSPELADQCLRNLTFVRRVVMGFDADEGALGQFVSEQDALCRLVPGQGATIRQLEDEILEIFTDVCSLSQRRLEVADETGEEAHGQQEHLFTYLRSIDGEGRGFPVAFIANLQRALAHYGVASLERTPELEESLFSIFKSQRHVEEQLPAIMAILERRIEGEFAEDENRDGLAALLERIIAVTQGRFPAVADVARELQYRRFDLPFFEATRARVYSDMESQLEYLAEHPVAPDRAERMAQLVECPQPMQNLLTRRASEVDGELQKLMLEVLTRRYYRNRTLQGFRTFASASSMFAGAFYAEQGRNVHLFSSFGLLGALEEIAAALRPALDAVPEQEEVVVDLYLWKPGELEDADSAERAIRAAVTLAAFPPRTVRVLIAVSGPGRGLGMDSTQHFTYLVGPDGYEEDRLHRGLHPMMQERLQMWRLKNFRTERLPSVEDVYLFRGVAYDNAKDERLFAIAEVRDLTAVRDESGRIVQLPYLERMFMEALAAIRRQQAHRPAAAQMQGNRVMLYVWPPVEVRPDELHAIVNRLAAATEGMGMEKAVVQARMRDQQTGQLKDTVLHFSITPGSGVTVLRFETPTDRPIQPLSDYRQKVVQLRRRGLVYPYELVAMLASSGDDAPAGLPRGDFVEHDLVGGKLEAVGRPPGSNTANLVVGVIRNFTWKHPEGLERVIVLGDPSRSLGALAEPECRRVVAALDLAEQKGVPLEWFAVSSGARISMDSGTENMDWIAAVLRRLIEFTQAGGEVNLVVNGINVGAQPYWNAEATMLMHTKGILVMTPEGAMVLTGKQALDYSGGVSAENNYGIGGYERIMGPNGQSQYWAPDLVSACKVLLHHYEHTYRARGERFPRPAATSDARDRDVRDFPHPAGLGSDFTSVGDIFSSERNPERKTPFDMRTLMAATIDRDLAPLERWLGMRDAETTVVWDAHLGGYPVCLIGIESKPMLRRGPVPADGPQQWTAGTLFPLSSKKVARAINSASDNRPVVVLANLSGFDGSPESMRSLQLEFGAEIGRAVVNFKGPMVFCVVSRYHGGAFVVFSARLNEGLEVAAVEGSYASVIGGAPAAGVVFAGEVESRTRADARVAGLERTIAAAESSGKAALRGQLAALLTEVRSEKLGEVAAEFDAVHNVQRAQRVGSIHRIVAASQLRPYLIDAVERGMRHELEKTDRSLELKEGRSGR
jgi:acetyl/propionyl-CoA carboxylase alpha subunit/acetyl-CoA carboxylase carboxyltransferase component